MKADAKDSPLATFILEGHRIYALPVAYFHDGLQVLIDISKQVGNLNGFLSKETTAHESQVLTAVINSWLTS